MHKVNDEGGVIGHEVTPVGNGSAQIKSILNFHLVSACRFCTLRSY